ncbi:FCS-Like Zinc finger 6 [Nicotiana tomentosiformis]|uniref:FCS-Like Zinc finger 6 n=1 Tax=Nicotiana tomentosiformis TaxID=4098 RepID=UPI00051B0870|nr:FCS-Like Zinc finger 6 [Nicotiana tomentosiformis]
MLLGKRARPPIKRTTSMKEFTLDLNINDPSVAVINYQPFDPLNPYNFTGPIPPASNGLDQRLILTRRRSADNFVETAHFLRACFLCKRQLIPGRDIYMYRGDSAFCSLDCREKQMKQDERKEKFPKVATRKKVTNSAAIATVGSGTGSDAPPQARP